MRRIHFLLLLAIAAPLLALSSDNVLENYLQNRSSTYAEVSAFYRKMDTRHETAKLLPYGFSDNGKPLHLFVISAEKIFEPEQLKAKGRTILFVNNGIHPGEPDGVEACMLLTKELLEGRKKLPAGVILCIVPLYNIDGAMIRSPFFRSGQTGPDTVGFRGNARNLDLNRDFIKCDSENAKAFTQMYRHWDPDVFIDTHVTDGADYQHVMTLIDSQKDKLSPGISKVMQSVILPSLYKGMEQRGFPMCPYVNVWGESPEHGMSGFMETPRYASGYAALFHAFPFVTETHMLKPFRVRVEATLGFLELMLQTMEQHSGEIISARRESMKNCMQQTEFVLQRSLDSSRVDSIAFRGYTTGYRKSNVTGLDLLYFDTTRAYQRNIPYFNFYTPSLTVNKPVAYLVPQAWSEVVERLKLNRIEMQQLCRDTLLKAEVYYIRNHTSPKQPYEGHYVHQQVAVEADTQFIQCFSGDYLVYCEQSSNRYIVETLDPRGPDAFFAWNFFDEILQQKEWFSDYLWDESAAQLLQQRPDLRQEFESKKAAEPAFANNAWAMYSWIFEKSNWHEPSHLRYPVLRIHERIPGTYRWIQP